MVCGALVPGCWGGAAHPRCGVAAAGEVRSAAAETAAARHASTRERMRGVFLSVDLDGSGGQPVGDELRDAGHHGVHDGLTEFFGGGGRVAEDAVRAEPVVANREGGVAVATGQPGHWIHLVEGGGALREPIPV